MVDKVLRIIYYIVYAIELFWIGEEIFHNRVMQIEKYVIMVVVYLLVIIPAVLYIDNNFLIILMLNISIYVVLFQENILLCMAHFVAIYLLTNITESIVAGIGVFLLQEPLKYLNISAVRSEGVSLFFVVVTAIFLICFISRKWTQRFIGYCRTLKWFQYLLIIVITLSGILLLGINMVILNYIDNKKVGTWLFVTSIILIGTTFLGIVLLVLSVYSGDYYLKQNQLKTEIICMQQRYFQNIYDNDKEMRNFRHDIYSQLGCLQLLLAEGKTEQAIEHLELIGNHFEKLSFPKCHTGSEVLDVIINQKLLEAKKKDISIKIQGTIDKPDFMDIYDLCILFSNVISNSIEACDKLEDREKIITISIVAHRSMVFFQFTNPATQEMYDALKQGGTTKLSNQNHGFGVKNIQRVVKKHEGEIEYLFKDGRLIVEIYFEYK